MTSSSLQKINPIQSTVLMRKLSGKDHSASHQNPRRRGGETILLLTFTFAALVLIVCGFRNNVLSEQVAQRTLDRGAGEIPDEVLPSFATERKIKSTGEIPEGRDESLRYSPVPPVNVTEEERIAWFRRNLSEFDILKSTNLTKEFHLRVLSFFDRECEVQFFMTWISLAESFKRREFLTLESLFQVHPDGCLIILSKTMDSPEGYRILKPLLDRGIRVTAIAPDLPFLVRNTPAEAWFEAMKSGNKDPGVVSLSQNLSNLIRLAALYKYGGVYLDTDFIVLNSFTGLRNSIGAQSVDTVSKNWTRLNNAALVFDREHPLLFKFIQEFALTFDGNKWGHNGPYLVSRVVKRVTGRPGYNFTVLPPVAFYPADWSKIGGYFRKPRNEEDSKWVWAKLLQLNGETYGVHLWNKQSSRHRVEEGSVMGSLLSDHCVVCGNIYSS